MTWPVFLNVGSRELPPIGGLILDRLGSIEPGLRSEHRCRATRRPSARNHQSINTAPTPQRPATTAERITSVSSTPSASTIIAAATPAPDAASITTPARNGHNAPTPKARPFTHKLYGLTNT